MIRRSVINRGGVAVSLSLLLSPAHPALAQAVWQNAPGTRADTGGANGWVATIPFAEDGDPLVFVAVRVNGAEAGWWSLDSGASVCLIDRTLARRLRLATRGSRQIHGTGSGTVGIDSVRGPAGLTLRGGADATCNQLAAADLSGLTATTGRPVAGILGYDFFARYVVQIDYAAHAFRLYQPGVYRYAGRGDTLPIALERRQPRVTVRIDDGGRPAVLRTLIVDTGSGDAVDDSVVMHSTTLPRYEVGTTGLGTTYTAVVGTLEQVRLGRFTLTEVPSAAPGVGLIGNAVWSQFTCVFDYGHGRLFVEPNERFGVIFDRGPRSGLSFYAPSYRAMPTVSDVIADSPAAAVGIRPGDVVYQLDGRPVGEFGYERVTRLLNRRGNAYRLGLRRGGRSVQVVLHL